MASEFGSYVYYIHSIVVRAADDPYYCGLRARVSNFVKNKNEKDPIKENAAEQKKTGQAGPVNYQSPLPHPMMWHSRSYDSGMGNFFRRVD